MACLAPTTPGTDGTADPPDTSRPNIARAYDYLLGGKDNFAAYRDLAEKLLAIYPGTRQMVRENRRFLVRALDYVLAQAISQYVDLGAGLPTVPAVQHRAPVSTTPPWSSTSTTTQWSSTICGRWPATADPHVHAINADVAVPPPC